ncbi:CRAL/TRIO domain protein [Aspergillus nomiae NRRL 13137]|uniref:CRAL/TRIO domain protein n=1 Tax=Aspergillus nomiae NRRL (strain ATCC 15546 / NRRL 13137 / CBS 260.88 / M93) TaxID=1509407 RepID=A0A0L1IM88_ASPN3|nr:CRAL/TRIO domain protein [Aspergillus nomiae NRRL 13137]KNG80390.1 CRAL/TRIO domain protein [Aspergillus nomiae NRRL 13137]
MSLATIETGYVGSLTQDQEEKLLQLWAIFLRSCDPEFYRTETNQSQTTSTTSPKQRKKFFSLSWSEEPAKSNDAPSVPAKLLSELEAMKMSAQEIKLIQQVLPKLKPDELRSAFFAMMKQDHPDTFLLRYLRAEKWDVSKGFVKFVSALEWWSKQQHVEEEVIRKGELHALQQSQSTTGSTDKKDGEGFMAQLHMGKGFFHGSDKSGRPICVVRARTHKPGAQTEKALNSYILYNIELMRLLLVPPVETMTLIFDLTNFALSNMEYAPVKFIIQCFQENYPESLGYMLFYNAPWFFSGIWKVIRGWLDPVVAAKVHFVNSVQDLEQFIDRSQIVTELGGDEDWAYEYVEPQQDENAQLQDTTTRDSIMAQRQQMGEELFEATSMWLSAKSKGNLGDVSLQKDRRMDIARQLRENYWKLDPYVRSRTLLDRIGVIQAHGNIDFYPDKGDQRKGKEENEKEAKTVVDQVEYAMEAQVASAA